MTTSSILYRASSISIVHMVILSTHGAQMDIACKILAIHQHCRSVGWLFFCRSQQRQVTLATCHSWHVITDTLIHIGSIPICDSVSSLRGFVKWWLYMFVLVMIVSIELADVFGRLSNFKCRHVLGSFSFTR